MADNNKKCIAQLMTYLTFKDKFLHMKSLILIILMVSCTNNKSNDNQFSILHYNVKELRSKKLYDAQNVQVKKLVQFLNTQEFDILSLNEIEYKKENLQVLKAKLENKDLKYEVLIKANTGNNSTESSPDIVNYGRVPGEYSNGALLKFKTTNRVVIDKLKWKDFYKDDLSAHKLSSGESIPDTIELFDKSFSDTTIIINNKKVHLILLHTVPSYGFGNPKTVNFLRNQKQLEFLKWYINTDGKSLTNAGIFPLKKDSSFIIVGDLNVDIKAKTEGAKILKSIIEENNPWIPIKNMNYTHPDPKLMLDYIITSKDIVSVESKIIRDVSGEISDHLPIYGKFEIREY